MGLCKCPKRKVTNQFCYEHRVNVCENCMITNHPKCIVLSYLKWLQDGDYNPVCELCTKNLSDNECVRLVCYHVFHWHCLDQYAKQLPATIAPAGYTCPTCNSPIFPSSNLVSPVADILCQKFETVNWGRIGLGLPLLAEERDVKYNRIQEHKCNLLIDNRSERKPENTILHIDGQTSSSFKNSDVFENKFSNNVPRRLIHNTETKKLQQRTLDHDDNKYERRTMSEKFTRFHMCAKKSKYFQFYFRHKYRRYLAMAVFLFVGFFTFMLVLEKLGMRTLDMDNPSFNPNIRVNDNSS